MMGPIKRQTRDSGDAIYAKYMKSFESLQWNDKPVSFTSYFCRIVSSLMLLLLPQMFGHTFATESDRLMEDYGVTHFHRAVIIEFGRRSGKSFTIGSYEAVSMWLLGGKTGFFSPSENQSIILLEYTREFYKQLIDIFDAPPFMTPNNEKEMTVGRNGVKWASAKAYPFNPDKNRGLTLNRIYVDEAAKMPEKQFYETLIPMLLMDKAVMVCLSSPGDSNTWMDRCMTLMDDSGRAAFEVIKDQNVCDPCEEIGEFECEHRIPAPELDWHGVDVKKWMKQIYAHNKPLMMREIYGRGCENATRVYHQKKLERLASLPRAPFEIERVRDCFIGIDPNGGGLTSDTALVAEYFTAVGKKVEHIDSLLLATRLLDNFAYRSIVISSCHRPNRTLGTFWSKQYESVSRRQFPHDRRTRWILESLVFRILG